MFILLSLTGIVFIGAIIARARANDVNAEVREQSDDYLAVGDYWQTQAGNYPNEYGRERARRAAAK